ncbi:MAG: multiheme c-type cytochrome [Nitrospirota bacterium]
MRYPIFLAGLIILIILALAFSTMAGFREVFEKEFLSKPWEVQLSEESACIGCHTSDIMRSEFQEIPQEWRKSWHYQNNVSCHDCHGGDREDATMSMSHQRGFVGTPKYTEVPDFCGKCHIGILKNYLKSGHGMAAATSKKGPNCVTCHGSHNIQKANIDIINERLCTQCHSYERAKIMKQALFVTENQIKDVENGLVYLQSKGLYIENEKKELFRTQAEFHTLFHAIDVQLVQDSTDEFTKRLNILEGEIKDTFDEIDFRQNFSAFLMLVFAGLGITIFLYSKTYMD